MAKRILGAAGLLCMLAWLSPAQAQYAAQINAVDPADLVSITDATSADDMRDNLINELYGAGGLDTSLTPVLYNQITPTVAEYRVAMEWGLISRVYVFEPTTQRNPTTTKGAYIIHGGHGQFAMNIPFADLRAALTAAGYTVVTIDMPMGASNAAYTTATDATRGSFQLRDHNDIQYLQTPDFHALRVFLDPVVAVVNWLEDQGHVDIAMGGLSGGGWTTDLMAAIDPRIKASYSIAGSMSMYARSWTPPHHSGGDWEQAAVQGLNVDYLDLYVLGSIGSGRRHVNIHIVSDNCCFGGTVANHYAGTVGAVVAGIGGSYEVVHDYSVASHTVSAWAKNWIMSDLSTFW